MSRHVRLFALHVVVWAACGAAFAAAPRLIDSFDTGDGWKVLPGSDPASLFVSSRYRLQGAKAMGVRLTPGAVRKATVYRKIARDISGNWRLSVTVRAPGKGLSLSLLLVTGEDAPRRYISRAAELVRGWQRVDFPLNEEVFYLDERPGLRVRPADLAALKGIGFVIYNTAGMKAEMYFDVMAVERMSQVLPSVPADEKVPPEVVVVGDVVEVGVQAGGGLMTKTPVEGVFRGPSGEERRIAGFAPGGGDGWWLVRFRPEKSGEHSYHLVISSEGGVVTTPAQSFAVKAAEGAETGASRMVGMNVAWAKDFSPYLRALASHGANTVRIWLSPWGLNLEEEPGVYSPAVARRIDGIMAEASRLGIGVILTLATSGELTAGGWERNPYNRLNGGPCLLAEEFLTDDAALELFERKARYCIRRWGAYKSLRAIEPAGDMDAFPAPDDSARTGWLRRICGLIETEDPYRHDVMVGLASMPAEAFARDMSALSAIDSVGVHVLPKGEDPVPFFMEALSLSERIGKPVFVEEYGGAWRSSGDTADPDGSALKAGLWVGTALTGTVPLSWWWDSHIMGRKLFGVFKDLALYSSPLGRPVREGRTVLEELPGGGGAMLAGTLWPDGAFLVAYRLDALTGGEDAHRPLAGEFIVKGLVSGKYKLDLWDVSANKPAGSSQVLAGPEGINVTLSKTPVAAVRLIPENASEASLRIEVKGAPAKKE